MQIVLKHCVSLFGRYPFLRHLAHQKSRNLFAAVVGKLKTQYHRLFGRGDMQGNKPEALLARFKVRRLHVSFDHGDWRLNLDLESGSFPISQLRVHQTIERLRITNTWQRVDARRCDLIGVRTVIPDGVTHQQSPILLIKVANPNFD